MKRRALLSMAFILACFLAGAGLGWARGAPRKSDLDPGRSGLLLAADAGGDSDIELLRFTIAAAGEAEALIVAEAPLVDVDVNTRRPAAHTSLAALLGGGGPAELVPLPPGKYDVSMTPLSPDGLPSARCLPGALSGVDVVAGAVTEAIFFIKCQARMPAPDPFAALGADH